MAGTPQYIGRRRTSSGLDLATVQNNQQVATHTNPSRHSSRLIIYQMGGWIGNYSGSNTARYGLLWRAGDSSAPGGTRPGGVAAVTGEISASIGYTGGGGGSSRVVNLVSPFLTTANYDYSVAIANRGGTLGFTMIQASQIMDQPNRLFYRKSISKTNIVDPGGDSSTSHEGQICIWAIGEVNVAPLAPNYRNITGNISTRKPTFQADFRDSNKVLENGVAWDRLSGVQIQVRRNSDSATMWDYTYSPNSTEIANHRSSRAYGGTALRYYTGYSWRIRHRDRANVWGAWSNYLNFQVVHSNTAPKTPTNLSPSSTSLSGRTVTLQSTFDDVDRTLPDGQAWDYLDAYQIVIRNHATGALVWDSGTLASNSTERSNRRTSRSYTMPAWDIVYRYSIRHRDRAGAWSGYAQTTFRALSGGSVATPTSPSGRVTNPANPGSVQAVYTSTGNQNTNAVQVGLYNASGSGQLKVSSVQALTVSNGGTITRTWAQTGFGELAPGTTYQLKVRARDVNGNWTSWSAGRSITTNAPPNVPTLFGPSDGGAAPYLYTTSVRCTDPDQAATTTTVYAEYFEPDGTPIGTTTLPHLPGSGGSTRNVFGKIPSDLITEYQTVQWRTYSYDGYRYSGNATTATAASRSPLWTFTWAPVPDVEITAPEGPEISTSQPLIEWDALDQTHYRVQLRNVDGVVRYDTGWIASTTVQTHQIQAAANWIGGERWNRDETFEVIVHVRDTSTLEGTSSGLSLTLRYDPPEQLLVQIFAETMPWTKGTNMIRISHTQTAQAQEDFIDYLYYRTDLSGQDGVLIPGTRRLVARQSVMTTVDMIDCEVVSGQWYQYEVIQRVRYGNDVVSSDTSTVSGFVEWTGLILHMPWSPLDYCVYLEFSHLNSEYDVSVRWIRQRGSQLPIQGRRRVGFIGAGMSRELTANLGIVEDFGITAQERYAQLHQLWLYQSKWDAPDGRPHIICVREGRGGPDGIIYGELGEPQVRWDIDKTYAAELVIEERGFMLGEGIPDLQIDSGVSEGEE